MEDEIIRGEGQTAVKSKVGYLLAGPVNVERSHSNASVMKVIVSHKKRGSGYREVLENRNDGDRET